MQNGLHFHHQRLRKLNGPEPASVKVAVIDRMIWIAAFLGPLFTIPQISKIWLLGETTGVSMISWAAYALFSCVWLMYGLVHRERVLILSNVLWLLANGLVVLGLLIF